MGACITGICGAGQPAGLKLQVLVAERTTTAIYEAEGGARPWARFRVEVRVRRETARVMFTARVRVRVEVRGRVEVEVRVRVRVRAKSFQNVN